MENKVEILFGHKQLAVSLPEGTRPTIIRKVSLPKLPDQKQAIHDALEHPVSAKPFSELANGRKSACILICDITRPVPNKLFLRPMIEDLIKGGVKAADILVLVATGLHRSNEGAELEELVGDPWVLRTVRVENHFARNDDAHVDLGRTSRGTPVKIDRRFVDADLRVHDPVRGRIGHQQRILQEGRSRKQELQSELLVLLRHLQRRSGDRDQHDIGLGIGQLQQCGAKIRLAEL